jgi:hypothetical protein
MKKKVIIVHDAEPDDWEAIKFLEKYYDVIAVYQLDINFGFDRKKYLRSDKNDKIYQDGNIFDHIKEVDILFWSCNFATLVKEFKKDPSVFKNLTLLGYGSVNFRWAIQELKESGELKNMLNYGFGETYIFENYLAFDPFTSVTRKEFPEFFDNLKNDRNLDIIHVWNEYMLQECKNKMIKKYGYVKRDLENDFDAYKIRIIEDNNFDSMTIADLSACLAYHYPKFHQNWKKKKISFDETNHTEISESDDKSTLYVYCPDVHDKMSEYVELVTNCNE